jgi:hypothetical protein
MVSVAVNPLVSILSLVLILVFDTGILPAEKIYLQTLGQMRKLREEMINIVHLV